ncbi:uncharacterized protein HD556DRAFT_1429654 [Suillus plorans]|uniref:Uncharacterized protein n=1 Tax=Suillus plorans TaxID=116603 RepID=A0A9P7J4X5_9AGAM|nr:uncharacterized protein HD556DRAFT_1429654 [Suillus plorans]KAG1802954.1 hypothetical protein HD556DRAFT_1429654 [Suillus plorans]
MSGTQYIPHILYSTALTSISMHLLWQRKTADEDRARFKAQTSILQELVEQLRSGKPISDEEITKSRNLACIHGEGKQSPDKDRTNIGWTDVLWGRKTPADLGVSDEWERKDLEQIRKEIEAES